MKIKVLMITHNRANYTKLSLQRLCESVNSNTDIVVWDNNSNKETINILKNFEDHPRIECIRYNDKNEKLLAPTNWFWEHTENADLISKVDDDCLMPDGWCDVLTKAHHDIPDAGTLGCWRFLTEDFDESLAKKKIVTINNHMVMRNCWIEGSGYLMKRNVVKKLGLLKAKESYPSYCIRAAMAGFINGWYFPFIYQEHMDDPRAEHSEIKTDAQFKNNRPLSAIQFKIETREEWIHHLKQSARRLQTYSYNPNDFYGYRAKIIKKMVEITGRRYVPKVK